MVAMIEKNEVLSHFPKIYFNLRNFGGPKKFFLYAKKIFLSYFFFLIPVKTFK